MSNEEVEKLKAELAEVKAERDTWEKAFYEAEDKFTRTRSLLERAGEEIQELKEEIEKLKHQLEHCRDALRELTDLGAPASILADYALRNLTEMEKE